MSKFSEFLGNKSEEQLNEASGSSVYGAEFDSVMGFELKSEDGKQTIWLEASSPKEERILKEVGSKLKGIKFTGSYNIRL